MVVAGGKKEREKGERETREAIEATLRLVLRRRPTNHQFKSQCLYSESRMSMSESASTATAGSSSSVILRIKRKRDQDPVEALHIDQSQRALKRRGSTSNNELSQNAQQLDAQGEPAEAEGRESGETKGKMKEKGKEDGNRGK